VFIGGSLLPHATEAKHSGAPSVIPAILRRESTAPLLDARWKIAGMTNGAFFLGRLVVYVPAVEKQFAVYILASKRDGTLYVGVTSALAKRVWEHKQKVRGGFTAQYGVDRLVYYEVHGSAEAAIEREKRLKEWNRLWKIRLIERRNPRWRNLYDEVCG